MPVAGEPATVGVVVVSYFTGPSLFACLESALAEPETSRLVLVDNGNDPQDRARLAAWSSTEPRLCLIRPAGNLGFAAGCHAGVAALTFQTHVLLLNPDGMLAAGSLAALLRAGEPGEGEAPPPDAWIAGPLLLNPDGGEQRGGRRTTATPLQCLGEALRLYRLPGLGRWRVNLAGTPFPPGTSPVATLSGACMLMPRGVWNRLGGLDPGFFLHVEDLDLCHRLRQIGGGCRVTAEAVCRHLKGTSRVAAWRVERHKLAGFWRYFFRHFRPRYGGVALAAIWLVIAAGLGARLALGFFTAPRKRDPLQTG